MAHHITDSFIARQLPKLMAGRSERTFFDTETTGFALKAKRLADDTLSGLFYAVWYLQGGAKIRKQKAGVMGTDTADDARIEAEKILLEVKQGNDPTDEKKALASRPLFDDLAKDFEEGRMSELKPKTRQDYANKIKRVLMPEFKGKFVADITEDDIDSLRRKRRDKPSDLNSSLAILSSMMTLAVRKKWRSNNPTKAVERLKTNPKRSWADETDLPVYLRKLEEGTEPIHELLRYATITGWRISEVRLLHRDQIDTVRQTASIETKTGAVVKHLSDDALSIIERQPHNIGFIFSNNNGKEPIGYKGVRVALADLCAEAGIKKLTPHSLRRTAATWSAQAGADVAELMQSFNWKTASMAMHYVQESQSIAKKGVERTSKVFSILGKEEKQTAKVG